MKKHSAVKPTMMPGAQPMATATPPTMGSTPPGTGVTAQAAPATMPKFNPDNMLPPNAFHKPGR